MPGISKKRLEQVRKALELTMDEADFEMVTKGLDGVEAAIEKGEAVTAADLADILGEVIVEKAVTPEPEVDDEIPTDPIAQIIKSLFETVHEANGAIRKDLKPQT